MFTRHRSHPSTSLAFDFLSLFIRRLLYSSSLTLSRTASTPHPLRRFISISFLLLRSAPRKRKTLLFLFRCRDTLLSLFYLLSFTTPLSISFSFFSIRSFNFVVTPSRIVFHLSLFLLPIGARWTHARAPEDTSDDISTHSLL